MQAGRWHCGAKPNDQVVGFEHDGAGTIFPDALQLELEASISAPRQALESERGSSDVASEALELLAVATIDELSGVNADAEGFGDRRGKLGRL